MAVGGSIIGATAIVFSVVMLAVQLNFARIPFGLFRKLSSDLLLLSCFAATFFLGATIGMTAIIPDKTWVAFAILLSSWCAFAALFLFLFAYSRALMLISPSEQLQLIVRSADRSMRRWAKRADRASTLIDRRPNPSDKRDMARSTFFRANPHWERDPREAVSHLLSFARRYAEQGEYAVSSAALVGLVDVNARYINVRGKTFYPSNPFFTNPLSSESFISDVLEQVRRLVATAVARSDEEQVIQLMAVLARLCETYAFIDYGTKLDGDLHHSQLAAGYLTRAVESLAKTFGADVVMEGARYLGQTALVLLRNGRSTATISIAQSISAIALIGISKPGYEPVASTAVQQLANLAFEMLRSPEDDIGFAAREVRSSIQLVGQLAVGTPDGGALKRHNGYLKPYYSMTDYGTFPERLTNLVNAVVERPKGDDNADRVLQHIMDWSDQIYKGEKALLLAALEKRSFLALELISWIAHVATLIAVASTAPAASEHVKEQLIRNSSWLISVLDWLPSDKDSVSYVENFNVTEQLFEISLDMHSRELDEVAVSGRDVLLHWAFKAGAHETGWASLESALLALAVLAVWKPNSGWDAWLISEVGQRVAGLQLDDERRQRVAKRLAAEASGRRNSGIARGAIEQSMQQVDRQRLKSMIDRIVALINPSQDLAEAEQS